MFIGRSRELEQLNKRYYENKFEMAVIYGRRRVGKTTLINEFVKDKETCFYTGIEGNAKENLEGLSAIDNVSLATIYGITGGIPLYLSLMNDNLSVEDNMKQNFLEPNAYLYEEPSNLIRRECRDTAQYNSIIRAIATGASRLSEICTKTELDTAHATSYLNKLISFGIVKKLKELGILIQVDNSKRERSFAYEEYLTMLRKDT